MSIERVPINVLLRGGQSGGHIAVMDNVVGAGFPGPPLHRHDFDETFYVLEGELTFQLEGEIFTRTQGELAFAPRGVAHTFANLSGAEARTLIVCTPAGFERYFDRMVAERAGVAPPPEAMEPWPEVITVGPRIGERDPETRAGAIEALDARDTHHPDGEISASILPSGRCRHTNTRNTTERDSRR